jgi:hypothetical protein
MRTSYLVLSKLFAKPSRLCQDSTSTESTSKRSQPNTLFLYLGKVSSLRPRIAFILDNLGGCLLRGRDRTSSIAVSTIRANAGYIPDRRICPSLASITLHFRPLRHSRAIFPRHALVKLITWLLVDFVLCSSFALSVVGGAIDDPRPSLSSYAERRSR